MASTQAKSEPIPSNANAPKVKKVAASKKRDARKRPVKEARWWYKATNKSEDSETGSVGDCWACGASLEVRFLSLRR